MTETVNTNSGEMVWYDRLWDTMGSAYDAAFSEAFGPGEYHGQQGFLSASDIAYLAKSAGVKRNTRVLDVCCGPGSPAVQLAKRFSCQVLGVDRSRAAVERADKLAHTLGLDHLAGFRVADALDLPFGRERFEVVLLLETLIAFADKADLFHKLVNLLPHGGRFAFSAEVGNPLSKAEWGALSGDQAHICTKECLVSQLSEAGFGIRHCEDRTEEHGKLAVRLAMALDNWAGPLKKEIGSAAFSDLRSNFSVWSDWLKTGRVRKLLVVATKESYTNWSLIS